MGATNLPGATVFGSEGHEVGAVRDLHFRAGGRDVADGGRPVYRLTEIECGPVGVAHHPGYGHRDLAGPWPIDQILTRLARASFLVH